MLFFNSKGKASNTHAKRNRRKPFFQFRLHSANQQPRENRIKTTKPANGPKYRILDEITMVLTISKMQNNGFHQRDFLPVKA